MPLLLVCFWSCQLHPFFLIDIRQCVRKVQFTLAFVFPPGWANAPKLGKGQVKWAICVQWTVCQVALAANYIIRHAVGYYDYGLLVESVASRQLVSSLAHYSLTLSPPLFAFLTNLTDSVCRLENRARFKCCLPAVHHYCLLHVVFCGNDALMMAIVLTLNRLRERRHHPACATRARNSAWCCEHAGKVAAGARRCKLVILLCCTLTWDRVHWQAIDDFPSSRRSTWDAINS